MLIFTSISLLYSHLCKALSGLSGGGLLLLYDIQPTSPQTTHGVD